MVSFHETARRHCRRRGPRDLPGALRLREGLHIRHQLGRRPADVHNARRPRHNARRQRHNARRQQHNARRQRRRARIGAPLADPCTLATTEVVSSTFSTKAHGPNATQDAVGGAECTWTWLDPVQGPCAVIVAPRPISKFGKSKNAEDISGVGEAAYREPKNDQHNNISVRQHGSYVYIKMRCNGDGTNGNDGFTTQRQDTLNTFAKTVVEKL